ncbi:hypothetical protein SK128_013046, partial [Halocaridina rubra]
MVKCFGCLDNSTGYDAWWWTWCGSISSEVRPLELHLTRGAVKDVKLPQQMHAPHGAGEVGRGFGYLGDYFSFQHNTYTNTIFSTPRNDSPTINSQRPLLAGEIEATQETHYGRL